MKKKLKIKSNCLMLFFLISSFFLFTDSVLAKKEMVLVTWGGFLEKVTRETVVIPFEKATGIKVIMTTYPDFPKVKAMVDTGKVEWDVVDLEEVMLLRSIKAGILEPLDYSVIDSSNHAREAINPFGLGFNYWAGILAYSKTKFPGDTGPKSWADFWDVKKFPGKRALFKKPFVTLEIALLADGVPPDKLYPLDVDRAFKSLDRIKPHISVWWEKGAQPPQLLSDREVDMCYAYSGRIVLIKREGVPVEIQWNQAFLTMDYWVIPKGAKNKKEGMQFIDFMAQPKITADYASDSFYGPPIKKAWPLIDPKVIGDVAGNPAFFDKMIATSGKWWEENEAKVLTRWHKWILE